MISNIKHEFS